MTGVLDGVSIIEGHELAESKPMKFPLGWLGNGGEIGDKCAWTLLQNIALSTGTFPVQTLWSNANNFCVSNYSGSNTPAAFHTIYTGSSDTTPHNQEYVPGSPGWVGQAIPLAAHTTGNPSVVVYGLDNSFHVLDLATDFTIHNDGFFPSSSLGSIKGFLNPYQLRAIPSDWCTAWTIRFTSSTAVLTALFKTMASPRAHDVARPAGPQLYGNDRRSSCGQ